MNDYIALLRQSREELHDIFEAAAEQTGTSAEFVEKDLWVCFTLELLFGGSKPPCEMTFKGGTSLSKGYGLIHRFSEDIDIVLSPPGLWERGEIDELRELPGKQRKAAFEQLRTASSNYVTNGLRGHLQNLLQTAEQQAELLVSSDAADEQQTLLLAYPSLFDSGIDYVRPVVRIECGPRSAREPSEPRDITPFVSSATQAPMTVAGIPTITAARTFWEKVLILHGNHCRFRDQGVVPKERNRLSRHYYDVAMLFTSDVGQLATTDTALLDSVRAHNELAFPSAWRKYDEAVPGRFLLSPQPEVKRALEADFDEMQSMIFGEVPNFAWVLDQIRALEERLNT